MSPKAMELIDVPETKKPASNILQLQPVHTITASQPLKLSEINPSATNEGRDVEDEAFTELCASVRAHGVIEGIIVRPMWCKGWNGDPDLEPIDKPATGYEIIAGERRWRAAKKCGHEQIPATIRTMGDAEALEIQAIENAQRKNLGDVQEARAFARLMTEHGYSIDQMVERVGKSKSLIYGRMKLLEAPKSILDAVEKGKCSASVATLVGRIPNRDLREKAAKEILNPRKELGAYRYEEDEAMSVRDTKAHLESNYMVELKGAPFDVKVDKLVADVSPCAICPKRAGNLPDFDPKAGRADVCTDPLCFQAKKEAAWKLEKAKADEKGIKSVGKFSTQKHVELSDELGWGAPDDVREKKWSQAIKGQDVPVLMAQKEDGTPILVVDREAACAAARKNGIKVNNPYANNKPTTPEEKRKQEERDRKEEQENRVQELVGERGLDRIVKAVESSWPRTNIPGLHALVNIEMVRQDSYYCGDNALFLRRGWKELKQALSAIEAMEPGQLLGLLWESSVYGEGRIYRSYNKKFESSFIEACKSWKIDLKAVEIAVREELEIKGDAQREHKWDKQGVCEDPERVKVPGTKVELLVAVKDGGWYGGFFVAFALGDNCERRVSIQDDKPVASRAAALADAAATAAEILRPSLKLPVLELLHAERRRYDALKAKLDAPQEKAKPTAKKAAAPKAKAAKPLKKKGGKK